MQDIHSTIVNKEVIAARMFRHAARYWGHNDTDIDNFDPLVRLLIEACAVELYRISNEISSVQERMLEKLARLLTPEVYTAPRLAQAVMHARCEDASGITSTAMQFFYPKKIASKPNGLLDTNIDIFFSPVGQYKIINGDIKLIGAGSHLYAVNDQQYKETFLSTSHGAQLAPQTVWLGIEIDNPDTDLSGLAFFFDLKNHPNKNQLFPLVHHARWSINAKPVKTREGLWDAHTNQEAFSSFTSFEEFDINQTIERQINHLYKHQFVTLQAGTLSEYEKEFYPSDFERRFAANDLKQLQKKLLWIKVQLLPEFDEAVLDDLTVAINCFPIANRHLNETRYRLQSNFNIIPLLSNEQFLSVQTVQSMEGMGTKYIGNPLESKDDKGTYTIRSGDVERFDNRNAVEYMNFMLELLRDESRAFAALGQDFVASTIKELNQNIASIEQKVKQNISMLNQVPTYVLVNPFVEGESVFVEFWTTNGAMANYIRSGIRLDLYQGNNLRRDTLTLMTTTSGGRDKLQNTEILNAYRNTLLTRGRIVTAEDIKSYCTAALYGKANKVTVKKGVGISPFPKEGLINTIDVCVEPLADSGDREEWESLADDLKSGLEQQSAVFAHYRINVEHD